MCLELELFDSLHCKKVHIRVCIMLLAPSLCEHSYILIHAYIMQLLEKFEKFFRANSNRASSIASTYTKYEKEKKRLYEQRVWEVEHASFIPIVLSVLGGMARQATTFYKRLVTLLASKRDTSYSTTMNWLRCLISFSILRSGIQCVRGTRSSYH